MSKATPTDNTFASLLHDCVTKYGKNTMFVGEGFSKNYDEFYDDVQKMSAYLLSQGFGGKKIGLYAHNSYYWLVIFMSVVTNVGTIVPLDNELPEKELSLSAKRVKLDLLFYDKTTKDRVRSVANIAKIKYVDELDEILKRTTQVGLRPQNRECVALFFTSGTTSASKIVMLSENNLVSCAYASAAAFNLKTSDRYYTILPLHHTLPLMCAVLVPLTNGCSICFSENIKNMQKELDFYRPTALVVVPRLLEYMANSIKRSIRKAGEENKVVLIERFAKLLLKVHIDVRRLAFRKVHAEFGGKVRMIACGGAELDQRLFEYLDNLGFNIYQGYGLTESSPILSIRGMFVKSKCGVGRPLNNVNIKIDKPDQNGIGEVIAKAPQVMLGYYHDKKATRESLLKNGWLYTGDLGRITKDGNLEIVGRKKNVIITSNGKNVYPEELETLINYSELVKESIVCEMRKGSSVLIIAKIVPEDNVWNNKTLDREISKLIDDINSELPEYKHINKYIIQRDEFDKTTTLKIKRSTK